MHAKRTNLQLQTVREYFVRETNDGGVRPSFRVEIVSNLSRRGFIDDVVGNCPRRGVVYVRIFHPVFHLSNTFVLFKVDID